ncbi:DUF2231 domain-containing protein [Salinimicrobium flavum]|uniref:DUF2231 domain-containing protein n=1 Tax=Salinimicrobium flavum TaxID=1737065 RepID=A0ABW5J3S7_9FLAO
MEQTPEFWRTEVFHPLSVHFPIALLLVAFLFKVIALRYRREVWERGGTVLLGLGVLGVWVAIYTGDLADGAVSRTLCDPTVLKEHENMAWNTAWVFSAGLAIDLLRYIKFPLFRNMFFLVTVTLILAAGSGLLMYVGHLGATLVYQQAAGVYTPSADCAEFN